MRISSVVLFSGLVLLLAGCKKKDNTTEPESPSVITITTPLAATIVINGSVLHVDGNMSDNNVLAIAKLEIRNKTTGTVLNAQSVNTGNVGYYNFSWTWTVTGISAPTPAVVKVIARDKLGNEVFKEVEITLDT